MSWRSSSVRFRQIRRRLIRDWHHTVGGILVPAIGVEHATVGLSVRENVLAQPLGHRAPDRLGVVRISVGDLRSYPGLAPTEILELTEIDGAFQAVEWVMFGPYLRHVTDRSQFHKPICLSNGLQVRAIPVSACD